MEAALRFHEFFSDLTGGEKPYRYQERLARQILAERSVVLRAPTGAGKTWAAVAPFLYSISEGGPRADRLLYALPLRTLATSLHAEVFARMQTCGRFGEVRPSAERRDFSGATRYCSLQIGGQKDDPFFQADLTFTTIDQLLSSYLLHPVSLPPKLDNINAGALIGSFLVCDELHLLEPERALGTTIEMLHRLHVERHLCQFVLMTATMSDNAIRLIAEALKAEVFEIPDEEIRKLPAQRSKRRCWRWRGEPLSFEAVLDDYRGGRAIVLLNTVARAQQLFIEIRDCWPDTRPRPELILLHSRFFPDDRKAKEAKLAPLLGPQADAGRDVILVTTQVVEAGVDISAELLLTEIAPMNALVQRAGRTARYPEPRNVGEVVVFDLETNDKGEPRWGPYQDESARVEATKKLLERLLENGVRAANADELAWIEKIHSEAEGKALRGYRTMGRGHPWRTRVGAGMDDTQRSCLSDLVRDISSVNVLITENPDEINFARGRWPAMIGVEPRTLIGGLRHAFDDDALPWAAKGARPAEESESRDLRFKWVQIPTANALSAEWLVALHPKCASYDPDCGLQLGVGAPAPALQFSATPQRLAYSYRFETWEEHARAVMEQGRIMAAANRVAAEKLGSICGVDAAQVERWVELVCALHDVGKLQVEWQAAAWRWQRDREAALGSAPAPDGLIAHTDYDPAREWIDQRQQKYARPNHAMESALAAMPGLVTLLKRDAPEAVRRELLLATLWAIARHHSARLHTVPEHFDIAPSSESAVAAILREDTFPLATAEPVQREIRRSLGDRIISFREECNNLWPLYCHLSRRLRLADQEGTRENASGTDE